jgi:predicted PurR-regulated permease PerM
MAVVCLSVLVGAYALWLLRSVLLLALLAVMLGTSIEPAVNLLRRGPFTRGSGVLAIYCLVIAVLAVPAAILIPSAVAQASTFAAQAPATLDRLRASATSLEPAALRTVAIGLVDQVDSAINQPGAPLGVQLVTAGATAVKGIVDFLTVFVLAYYWLVERASIKRIVLRAVAPDHAGHINTVWVEIEEKLGAWVRGQLVCMLAVGVTAGAGFFAIGLPQPILLGVVAGLCEIVPLAGPLLAFAPAVLVAFTVGPQTALGVLLFAVVVQQLESNVLVPRVISRSVGVSPLTVLLGVLAGATLAGIYGALVAVPVAAATQVVFAHLLHYEPASGEVQETAPA